MIKHPLITLAFALGAIFWVWACREQLPNSARHFFHRRYHAGCVRCDRHLGLTRLPLPSAKKRYESEAFSEELERQRIARGRLQ